MFFNRKIILKLSGCTESNGELNGPRRISGYPRTSRWWQAERNGGSKGSWEWVPAGAAQQHWARVLLRAAAPNPCLLTHCLLGDAAATPAAGAPRVAASGATTFPVCLWDGRERSFMQTDRSQNITEHYSTAQFPQNRPWKWISCSS